MKKANPIPQITPNIPDMLTFETWGKDANQYLARLKTKEKPSIVFFGSDSFIIPVLKALEDNFEVKAIVTSPNSAVANYFNGLILTPDKLDQDFLTSHFSLLTSHLFIVSSYGKIIPKELLDIPKFGALNVHPSLLPKYRGASPVPAAILNGNKETGVTIIKMDEKMDHGPILVAKEVAILPNDTFESLANKLFLGGVGLLIKIIPGFLAGKVKGKIQNHQKATFTKILKKEDGYFDIEYAPSAEKLDRMVRAYYPWPGVWCRWNGKIVKFLPNGLTQMEGKKPLPLKDFLNGYPGFPLKSITIDKK